MASIETEIKQMTKEDFIWRIVVSGIHFWLVGRKSHTYDYASLDYLYDDGFA
jgi:hypothetical protein